MTYPWQQKILEAVERGDRIVLHVPPSPDRWLKDAMLDAAIIQAAIVGERVVVVCGSEAVAKRQLERLKRL